jgi:uncharacterized sporulation protein YeaH/YhbH (DUF444 family)
MSGSDAELMVLRQMQDAISRIDMTVATMQADVSDVKERVIRIEAQETKAELRSLEARIGVLEADKQRREGAVGFLAWIGKNAPWLTAVAAAVAAYFGLKHS